MSKSVKCTSCGATIDLKEALYEELKSDFKDSVNDEVALKTKSLTNQINSLTKLMSKYMAEAGEAKAKSLELQFKLDNSENDLDTRLQELLKVEKLKMQEYLNQKVESNISKIKQESELKVIEKTDIINQLKKQLNNAQQRIDQGLTQAQGTSQEIYLADFLRKEFPLDTIEEIKKGVSGADCIQVVNTRIKSNVGYIYIESKKTKVFNNTWIDKFKQDMRSKNITTGVLVSTARPTGYSRATRIKGIWVCNLEEFKVIIHAIRHSICSVDNAVNYQKNKGDKMELIYDYITSDSFKAQVDTIIDSFSNMQEDLTKEKRAMKAIWKKRQIQIDQIINSTIDFHSTLVGIGKNAVPEIHSLRLE